MGIGSNKACLLEGTDGRRLRNAGQMGWNLRVRAGTARSRGTSKGSKKGSVLWAQAERDRRSSRWSLTGAGRAQAESFRHSSNRRSLTTSSLRQAVAGAEGMHGGSS